MKGTSATSCGLGVWRIGSPRKTPSETHRERSILFHHSEREMGCSRCLKRSYAFQLDRLRAEVIEEANALTQENRGNVHMEFVEQTRLQGLLDGACAMKGHIFLACQLLCLLNRAFNA